MKRRWRTRDGYGEERKKMKEGREETAIHGRVEEEERGKTSLKKKKG